jgi:Uma2 family endonuclease
MVITHQNLTAEQLLATPGLGRCELVRGELIMMTPAGFEQGCIAADLCTRLSSFVRQKKLGHVSGAETGFQIARDPDTVRAPDVGFVRAERVPSPPPRGYFQGPPDLAVEVLSPDDRASEVLAKVNDWLAAGCLAVWVVDPAKRTACVYPKDGQAVTRGTADEVSGGDILPGFRLPVGEVFAA